MEYSVRFSHSDVERVGAVIRSTPLFSGFEATYSLFEFRSPENTYPMPDAYVKIASDGLHFCDNGGAGGILEDLANRIGQEFGRVSVEDLE
jgi:hypothetical protein